MDQEWERRSREFKEWLNSPEFAAHIQKCKEEIEQKIGYGDCFTIDEFIEEIEQGSINGYDGIGYFYDAIFGGFVLCFYCFGSLWNFKREILALFYGFSFGFYDKIFFAVVCDFVFVFRGIICLES